MPRVKIGPALPDREKLDVEIARLRDLDVGQLRSRWHTAFGRPAPAHLARHLLFRSLAYRLQADRLGDLNGESQRLLDRSGSPEKAGRNAVRLSQRTAVLRPGTILAREWNGQMQRVAVLADGFAWNGNTYPSLSKVAFAITGRAGMDRNSSACETNQRRRRHHEDRINESGSLRDLYPRLDRPRTRTRLQLARRPV